MNVPNRACSGLMKTGETNGRGHWRPRGGLGVPAHEATSEHKKKPDASPYAVMKVRPRTCSKDEQKNAQQARHNDTMVPAGIFRTFEQKSCFKLGRFSSPFAEITN